MQTSLLDSIVSGYLQLDFAATLSALLGISFPFGRCLVSIIFKYCFLLSGKKKPNSRILMFLTFAYLSIGHVNPELYALGSSSLNLDNTKQPAVNEWMQSYVNVLCVNAWQVTSRSA